MRAVCLLKLAVLVAVCLCVDARADSPTVEEIFAKAVEAVGGRETVDKIKTVHAVMEMNAGGMAMEMETFWSRDGWRLVRTKTPMGSMEMGTDGKTSWKKGPMGSGKLTQEELGQLDGQAGMIIHMLDPALASKDQITDLKVLGTQTFRDKNCHRVHYTAKDGREGDLYFDVESGMLLGSRNVAKQDDEEVTNTMYFSDWKVTKDVKVFGTMTMESPGQPGPMQMKVASVQFNTLDDAAFAAPQGVAAAPADKPAGDGNANANAEIKFEDLTPQQQEQAKKMLDGLKQSGNVAAMKQTVSSIEPVIGMMPANQKPTMQYVLQELKKEIVRLGG